MLMRLSFHIGVTALPMSAYDKAAAAAGWAHAGDFGGFWFDAKRFDAWQKAAQGERFGLVYETAKELCEAEGISI